MKESKLIEMQNKIKSLSAAMKELATLAVGTSEVVKHMPDYKEALDKMIEEKKTQTESQDEANK